jgi:hypothetical protein
MILVQKFLKFHKLTYENTGIQYLTCSQIFSPAANVGPIWTLLPVDSDTSIPLTKLRPAERLAGDDERKSHQSGFVYPLMKLTPPERLTGDDEANAQNLESQEVCEFCKLLAREAQSYVKTHENVTEEKLEKWVNQFCDAVMRKDQSTRCHDLVDKYGAAFVNAVINDLSPDIVSGESSFVYWLDCSS